MMGINKNEPFPHLFKSHRPVTLTTLARVGSQATQNILVPSLEASGSYPLDIFAHCADIHRAFTALTFRVVVAAGLQLHGTTAVTDWDSANAFIQQQREESTPCTGFWTSLGISGRGHCGTNAACASTASLKMAL